MSLACWMETCRPNPINISSRRLPKMRAESPVATPRCLPLFRRLCTSRSRRMPDMALPWALPDCARNCCCPVGKAVVVCIHSA